MPSAPFWAMAAHRAVPQPRHRPDLFKAIVNRNQSAIYSILNRGATWKCRDDDGQTVLHMAVMKRCDESDEQYKVIQILNQFIGYGMKADVKCKVGRTALHIAAKNGMIDVVDYLMKQGVDLHAKDERGNGILHYMVEGEFDKYFELTRKHSLHDQLETFYGKSVRFFERMLAKKIEVDYVNKNLETPLHMAVRRNLLHILPILLKHTKIVSFRDKEYKDALHELIENKNCGTYLAISTSCYDKRLVIDILKTMLCKGYSIVAYDDSFRRGNLLHLLSQQSSSITTQFEEIINTLVSKGCRVNSRDKRGMAPIHLAVQSGKIAVIEGLVKCHASVDAREPSARCLTPLQMAVEDNNHLLINTLVKLGADVNAQDASGKTALHLAMRFENNIVEKLLRLGAYVDEKDYEEQLPLHYAIKYKNGVALTALLKFGADINDVVTYPELMVSKDPGPMLLSIVEHWVKMKAAGLPVAPDYRMYVASNTYQKFHRHCLNEIEDLKAYEIANHKSLYDLLHMDSNLKCAYTVNKPLKDLIESKEFQTKFPKYHVLILASYHEAFMRQALLEPAKRAWYEFTKSLLPEVCVYRILAYLKNRDLRVIVEGLGGRDFRNPCKFLL